MGEEKEAERLQEGKITLTNSRKKGKCWRACEGGLMLVACEKRKDAGGFEEEGKC